MKYHTPLSLEQIKQLTKEQLAIRLAASPKSAWAWANHRGIKLKRSPKVLKIALKELTELSNGREDTAIRIIQKSIASGWAGLFRLSDEKGKSITSESLRASDDLIASMSKDG